MRAVERAGQAAIVLALMSGGPSFAAEQFVLVGPGAIECAKVLELKDSFDAVGNRDEFESALAAYAQGFWSGLNFQRRSFGDTGGLRVLDIDRDAITRELLDRCGNDPGAPLFTHLWIMFNGFRTATSPE